MAPLASWVILYQSVFCSESRRLMRGFATVELGDEALGGVARVDNVFATGPPHSANPH